MCCCTKTCADGSNALPHTSPHVDPLCTHMHSRLQAASSSEDDSSEDDSSSEEEEEKKPAAKKEAAKPAAKVRPHRQLLHMPGTTSQLLCTSTGRRRDSSHACTTWLPPTAALVALCMLAP